MLKINKKLLSLRGVKRRSNLNNSGFSLIELMVAIVILALAIFGIFHAYSTGFMGMADARDRTVATNYAREAMEDIKNKDFDKIIPQSRNYIAGTKYEREVVVQESINLKKVTTKVYWHDRNGNTKMVETDMAVHFIVTTSEAAIKIILYADPYNILTDGTSTLTAVVKDAKGNTVTTPEYNILFSITQVSESAGGVLSSSSKTTIKGKATTTFTSSGGEGEVTITASATELTSDSVTIKVTDPSEPVKINLTNWIGEEEKLFMTPGSESTITATIVNAIGTTVAISKEITFSVSGPGNLSTPTTLTTVDGDGNPTGIATITLISNGTPGTITVTASSTDLKPGVIDVITGGQISLSASLIDVPVNEKSVITITTKDVNGVPIKYIGDIQLSIGDGSTGSGDLPSEPVNFDGSSPSVAVDFTAGNTPDTIVNINAVDLAEILTAATPLSLNIKQELIPDHIEVYAIPSSIPAGGTETSLITAKVMTENNIMITSYSQSVSFETTLGDFISKDENFTEGVATAVLESSSDLPGTATITVCSPSVSDCVISGETTVGFFIGPDHIILNAVPQNISAGGQSCIVTAKIVDNNGTLISDYNEDITFVISPWPITIKFTKATTYILTQKVKKGIATVILKSGDEAGTAVINAYSGDISGSLNIPVGISLILVSDTNSPKYVSNETENSVSFKIEIVGADLSLEEMQVSWDPLSGETLNKIEIKSLYTADPAITVFNDSTNPVSSGELIDIEDITLLEGTSAIVMYFNNDMSTKTTLDVTFNPNSGDYTVNLIE